MTDQKKSKEFTLVKGDSNYPLKGLAAIHKSMTDKPLVTEERRPVKIELMQPASRTEPMDVDKLYQDMDERWMDALLRGLRNDKSSDSSSGLPVFEGFPYLATRVFPALYHITLYPIELSESELIELARKQVHANKIKSCLALAKNDGLWFDAGGNETRLQQIPSGGAIVFGKLHPPKDFLHNEEFTERSCLLEQFSKESTQNGGNFVGDPRSCVREATSEDDTHLGKLHGNILPSGLAVCKKCGEWKGECFYPASRSYPDKVWKITCRCDNDNLCALCRQPLADHKLDSCYFDNEAGKILHVAGYSALGHVCQYRVHKK